MKKFLLTIFFAFSLLTFIYSIGKIYINNWYFPDLASFYQDGVNLRQGIDPYLKLGRPAGGYPPLALVLFKSFAFLSFDNLNIIYPIISVLFLFLSLALLSQNMHEFLLFGGLSLLAFPVKYTFGTGQINFLILALITLNLYFYKKDKDIFSGIALGLSLSLKLLPVFLLFYFLGVKRYKLVISCLLTGLAGLGLSLLVLGWPILSNYFLTVFPGFLNTSGNIYYYNQSLQGTIGRLAGISSFSKYFYFLLIFMILVLSFGKKFKIKYQQWALVLTANMLINPFVWQHHLVFLLPALAITYQLLQKTRAKTRWWFLLGIVYGLLSFNIKNPVIFMSGFSGNLFLSHGTLGIILLWLILLLI